LMGVFSSPTIGTLSSTPQSALKCRPSCICQTEAAYEAPEGTISLPAVGLSTIRIPYTLEEQYFPAVHDRYDMVDYNTSWANTQGQLLPFK
jgi:hypothetical protein